MCACCTIITCHHPQRISLVCVCFALFSQASHLSHSLPQQTKPSYLDRGCGAPMAQDVFLSLVSVVQPETENIGRTTMVGVPGGCCSETNLLNTDRSDTLESPVSGHGICRDLLLKTHGILGPESCTRWQGMVCSYTSVAADTHLPPYMPSPPRHLVLVLSPGYMCS